MASNRSPRRPSVMTDRFESVPGPMVNRSRFNLSHGHKTTLDAGFLVPIFGPLEVLPADTIQLHQASIFARMNTLLHPILDNIYAHTAYWFGANRLLWDDWKRFMGERDNPDDSIDFEVPTFGGTVTATPGDIYDHMGIPIGVTFPAGTINALPFRLYNRMYADWYKKQYLIDNPPIITDSGSDIQSSYSLLKRAKRGDYFTSCLPWPQRGPGAELPLSGNAPVSTPNEQVGGAISVRGATQSWDLNSSGGTLVVGTAANEADNLFADLSQVSAATINDLRQAFAIQRFEEREARGGSRYTEIIRSFYGVISPDARQNRIEYLGGSRQSIQVNTVPQTTQDLDVGADSPQATLAAYATLMDTGGRFTYSATEHGYIIGVVCLYADLTYQQGLDRLFSRKTRYDFFFPTFQHLGEQPVYNREIYAQGDPGDDGVFGYQERHADYRFVNSKISGLLRSTAPQSLDPWHLSQHFTSSPTLGQTFIEESPPIDRVVALPEEPDFLLDAYFNLSATRPMPTYGVPGYLDHF